MSASMLLTIIGTIATIGLGGWGIYLTLKRRYPGRITFFGEDYIGLFDSIVRNLPDLSVLYKGNPVKQNLVLLKGILVNTGSKDITQDMVEDELSINLPEGYKWLAGDIVSASNKRYREIVFKSESSLSFNLGLFRCNEFIRFEALAEVPLDPDNQEIANLKLEEAISFSHRIADTQGVDLQNINSMGIVSTKPILFILLLCLGGTAFMYFSPPQEPARLIYSLKTKDDKVINVELEPQQDGALKLQGYDNDYSENLSVDEFYFRRVWKPKILTAKEWGLSDSLLVITLITMSVFVLVVYIIMYQRRRRMDKLRTLLNLPVK